jgi:hypothetical protein
VLLLLPVHNSCELPTTAGRSSSSSTVSPLHNKDINEHRQTPPAMAFIVQHTSLLLLQHKSNQITGAQTTVSTGESHKTVEKSHCRFTKKTRIKCAFI